MVIAYTVTDKDTANAMTYQIVLIVSTTVAVFGAAAVVLAALLHATR